MTKIRDSRPRIIAGIDPGYSGGIAFVRYTPTLASLELLRALQLPTRKIVNKGKSRTAYDVKALKSLLQTYQCSAYVLEQYIIAGRDGKFSMTATAEGFGLISGLIYGLNSCDALIAVHPLTWQKQMFSEYTRAKGDTKELSAKTAVALFPEAKIHTARGKLLDGISDAICLAVYGTRADVCPQ